MFDSSLTTRIRDAISVQLGPRDRTMQGNLQAQTRVLSARGMAVSGVAVTSYSKIAGDELRVRAGIVWGAIRRSHASMVGQADDQTLANLQGQLTEHISVHATKVRDLAVACVKRMPQMRLEPSLIETTVANLARELIREWSVEAQFYVDELQRAARANSSSAAITIHGNVGAVQTGSYATAHVSMTGAVRDKLVETLETLRSDILQNAEASAEQREQATELAADVITAVKAEKPNGPKIAGLLGGLATTVQTVASLRGAWDFVRAAAIAAGIALES